MSEQSKMLSVAEVFEMTPGDDVNATWINPGFTAVVRDIKRTKTKKGGAMNICTLADTVGSATISMSVFAAIKFNEGDVIEVSGQGLRRTEYNGLQQVSLSQKTEIHILGKSVHHEEQKERVANSEPAINGQLNPVPGQTVGMAMKEAIALCRSNRQEWPLDAQFWSEVHTAASDIIRVSRLLESGKLAPSPKERATGKQAPPKTGTNVQSQDTDDLNF